MPSEVRLCMQWRSRGRHGEGENRGGLGRGLNDEDRKRERQLMRKGDTDLPMWYQRVDLATSRSTASPSSASTTHQGH